MIIVSVSSCFKFISIRYQFCINVPPASQQEILLVPGESKIFENFKLHTPFSTCRLFQSIHTINSREWCALSPASEPFVYFSLLVSRL